MRAASCLPRVLRARVAGAAPRDSGRAVDGARVDRGAARRGARQRCAALAQLGAARQAPPTAAARQRPPRAQAAGAQLPLR
eukprot:5951176-Pleurochrysis_carterae.AAC.1